MTKEQDYIPFGEEWKKEVSKIRKDEIIEMLATVILERDILSKVFPAKKSTAIDLIAKERAKQISKGYTAEHDAAHYGNFDLMNIVGKLITSSYQTVPRGWDYDYWQSLCNQPYEDRVRVGAAFLVAELERIIHLENKTNE